MTDTEWFFNEHGQVEADLEIGGMPTKFVLAPPKGRDVENIGVFVYHNPGNQMGAMMKCAVDCLVEPKLTIEQLRDMDAQTVMEVVKGLEMFPVFHKGR